MNEAVEDGIGQRRLANGLVPMIDRQLTGDDGSPRAMAIFKDCEQITAMILGKRSHSEIL